MDCRAGCGACCIAISISSNIPNMGPKPAGVRADIAKRLKKEDKITMSVCFMMLDKKPYADVIWKNLRPEHERPFKVIE